MRPDYGYFEETRLGKSQDAKLFKRLFKFVRPYRRMLAGSIGLVVLITGLDLALPYATKIAIDRYIVPTAPAAGTQRTSTPSFEPRYLQVDSADPGVKKIIRKYRRLFTVKEHTAGISYADLGQLGKRDLALLRKNDIRGLGVVAAIFLTLVIFNFLCNFIQKMIMEITGHQIMHDLRMVLFNHIQQLSMAFFTRNPVGRLVTRVTNDVQNMHELFTSVISMIFKDLFLLAGIAVVMLLLNWKLALASFAVLPLVLVASLNFSRRARNIFRELRVKIAEINTRFAETIGGIRVIQLFGQQMNNYRKFRQLNHENYLAGMRQIHVLAVFMPLVELLGVVTAALVIFYGGSRVLTGSLSLGALVAFISYVRMFFRPMRDLAEKYNIIQNAMASAERIFLILDTTDTLPPPATGNAPVLRDIEEIRFDDVSFSYTGNEDVLKNVNFRIRAGETVGVVGPTGAGKTSLINLIVRFYDPGCGQVLLNGHQLADFEPSSFRTRMALVMQESFLFSGTIRENIFATEKNSTGSQVHEILEASNCKPFIDRLPRGLDTILTEGGASISSGERQLIAIARALARRPQLILFDEATSYVDSRTEQRIQQALEKLMQNRTALIVAHRLSTVRHADRILVINRGRIIERGTHTELMRQKGFYFRLHQWQTAE